MELNERKKKVKSIPYNKKLILNNKKKTSEKKYRLTHKITMSYFVSVLS